MDSVGLVFVHYFHSVSRCLYNSIYNAVRNYATGGTDAFYISTRLKCKFISLPDKGLYDYFLCGGALELCLHCDQNPAFSYKFVGHVWRNVSICLDQCRWNRSSLGVATRDQGEKFRGNKENA